MTSLKEYAKNHPVRGACKACESRKRKEIDEAFRNGIPLAVIARWCRDDQDGDVAVTEAVLRHHLVRAKHHAQT